MSGILVIFSISAAFAGSQKSRLEIDYGTSYKLAKYNQILNPEAEKNLKPVYGFAGKAAENVMEKYRKGFKKTVKKPAYIFTLGGEK